MSTVSKPRWVLLRRKMQGAAITLAAIIANQTTATAQVTSFNSRTGAVTLASSDVTTALGYTPANKAGDTFAGATTFSSGIVLGGTVGGTSSAFSYTIGADPQATATAGGFIQLFGSTNGNQVAVGQGGVVDAIFNTSGTTLSKILQITPTTYGSYAQSLNVTSPYITLNSSMDALRVGVGACPTSSEVGSSSGNFSTFAIVGCTTTPAGTYSGSAGWPDGAVAGFALNGNPTKSSVAVFGTAGATVANGSIYGGNLNVVNCSLYTSTCAAGAGLDFNVMYGNEIDVNVYSKSGSVAPAGAAAGVIVQLNADIQPAGALNAFDVVGAPSGVQFKTGYSTEAGSANVGLLLNALGPGASQASQPIEVVSHADGGGNQLATIQEDAAGILRIVAPAGVVLTATSGSVTSTSTFNAAAYQIGGTAGVSCSAPPTSNFAVTNGIVTHC